MKGRRVNNYSTPYGGVIPILGKLKEFGVPQVIRKCLGERKPQAKYSFADIAIAWILTAHCGGKRLDNITKLHKKLSIIKKLKLPSHDTLGRCMKQLAEETMTARNISKTRENKIAFTEYDDNINMNRMLVIASKRAGALKEGIPYTLDIDATFIASECRGAKRKIQGGTQSQTTKIGFNPMICLIGSMPVFVSMRTGDSGAKFQIIECLQNALNLLAESKIRISRVISDAAGYSKPLLEMLNSRGIKFVVRFPYQKKMLAFNEALKNCDAWRSTEIRTANNVWNCEIADIPYKMFDRPEEHYISQKLRVVAIRIPTEKLIKENDEDEWQRHKSIKEKLKSLAGKKALKEARRAYFDDFWREVDGYMYKFYVTNDFKKSSEELVAEFNNRGDAERKFSFMKNDFGWKYPPFMNMNENTVFFIMAALANNVFRAMVALFKRKIPNLKLRINARFPTFQNDFINTHCLYIDGYYEFENTDIPFELLI